MLATHRELRVTTIYKADARAAPVLVPFYDCKVPAGFPSPADDHLEGKLDLNKRLVRNAAATFFVCVEGDSMIDAGIHPGDTLVVDRSIAPEHEATVIACIEGELTVKRLWRKDGRVLLVSANENYAPIEVSGEAELIIWGVVLYSIHRV